MAANTDNAAPDIAAGRWKEIALGVVFLMVVGTTVSALIGVIAWIASAF